MVKVNYDLKSLRDLVLGDGYLVKPCGINGGSGFRCCQGIEQRKWLSIKMRILIDLGFDVTLTSYSDKRRNSITQVFYTETNHKFRKFYDRWYKIGTKGRMQKNYKIMLNDCEFDLRSLMILYLDNGHSEIRKSVIKFNTKEKIAVSPFFDNLTISCPYQDSKILAEKINRLGFVCNGLRPFELRSRIAIYRVDSKRKFLDHLKQFCKENKLENTFSYKYDLPVSFTVNDLARGRD